MALYAYRSTSRHANTLVDLGLRKDRDDAVEHAAAFAKKTHQTIHVYECEHIGVHHAPEGHAEYAGECFHSVSATILWAQATVEDLDDPPTVIQRLAMGILHAWDDIHTDDPNAAAFEKLDAMKDAAKRHGFKS